MSTPVYLLFGDEYLVAAKARDLVNSLVAPDDQAFGLEIVDGRADTVDAARKAVGACIEAVQTAGFLGSLKVVWLRDADFLTDTVTGRSESVKARVGELAELIKAGLPPAQVLVVTSPKVDKRYAFYKACKAAGEIHEFAVPDKAYLQERQAATVVDSGFEKMGLSAREPVRRRFLEKVGTDTRQIMNEIEKLAVYVGDRKTVELADIDAVTCSPRMALAWDLADAFGQRDLGGALRVLRQLLFQRESPIGLIVGLESRVRDLMIYRDALDRNWLKTKGGYRGGGTMAWGDLPPQVDKLFSEVLARDPRTTHPFRVGILAGQANEFTREELERCRQLLIAAHEKLVSSSVPADIVLEVLLVNMLGGAPHPAPFAQSTR